MVLLEAVCIVKMASILKNCGPFQFIRNNEIQISDVKDAKDRLFEFIEPKFEC